MNMPTKADVDDSMEEALAGLALGDPEFLEKVLGLRADLQEHSGLDPRSFALVKIAALIALDAPPASYLWQPRRETSSVFCARSCPRLVCRG
jgi:hypothetical protein